MGRTRTSAAGEDGHTRRCLVDQMAFSPEVHQVRRNTPDAETLGDALVKIIQRGYRCRFGQSITKARISVAESCCSESADTAPHHAARRPSS